MKLRKLLLLPCFISLALLTSAQITEKAKTSTSTKTSQQEIEKLPLFSRGMNLFTIQRNFDFTTSKPDDGGGHTNDLSVNLDYNYFPVDHIGVGVGLDLSSSSDHYGSTTKSSQWLASADVIYGTNTGGGINLYGKAGVGFGKYKQDYGGGSNTSDLFAYKIEVGAPIHVFGDGFNYLTPFVGYNFIQEKFSLGKVKTSEFEVGLRFENYAPCSGYSCDMHNGCIQSKAAYQPGRNFFDYTTMGTAFFGTTKLDPSSLNNETDISGGVVEFQFGHYILHNLAVGAEFNWQSQTQKPTGTSKYTDSKVSFTPMITGNLPADNCWNNLFLQVGYGFGQEKTTSGSASLKTNTTNYCVNLGFNDFIGKHIAITPKIGEDWETFKDTNTNIKEKWSAFEISVGVSLHF